MKIKIIISINLFFSILIFAQQNIPVYLSTEKDTFYTGEPIAVEIKCINTSAKALPFSASDFTGNLTILDERDNQYKCHYSVETTGTSDFFPGDTIITYSLISNDYGLVPEPNGEGCYGLPEGKYRVSLALNCCSISLKSNTIQIRVIPPVGKEKKAYELLKKGMGLFFHSGKENFKDLFLDLAANYPESMYAPLALNQAALGGGKNAKNIYKKIIDNYPNSFMVRSAIAALEHKYIVTKNKAGVEKLYREIMRNHPGTFAAKIAKRWLNRMKKLTTEEWLNPELTRQKKLKIYTKQNR